MTKKEKELPVTSEIKNDEALHDAFEYIVMLISLIAVIMSLVPILLSITYTDFWHHNIQNHAIPGLISSLPFLIYSVTKVDRRTKKNPKFKRTIYRLFLAYGLLAGFFISFLMLLETLVWNTFRGFNLFTDSAMELYSLVLIVIAGAYIWWRIRK